MPKPLAESQEFTAESKGFTVEINKTDNTVKIWNYGDNVKVLPFYGLHIDEIKKLLTQLTAGITWADSERTVTP